MNKPIIKQHILQMAIVKDINEKDFLKNIGIDSLKLVELVLMLEDSFNVRFSNSDLEPEKLLTVQDIYDLVYKYLEENK